MALRTSVACLVVLFALAWAGGDEETHVVKSESHKEGYEKKEIYQEKENYQHQQPYNGHYNQPQGQYYPRGNGYGSYNNHGYQPQQSYPAYQPYQQQQQQRGGYGAQSYYKLDTCEYRFITDMVQCKQTVSGYKSGEYGHAATGHVQTGYGKVQQTKVYSHQNEHQTGYNTGYTEYGHNTGYGLNTGYGHNAGYNNAGYGHNNGYNNAGYGHNAGYNTGYGHAAGHNTGYGHIAGHGLPHGAHAQGPVNGYGKSYNVNPYYNGYGNGYPMSYANYNGHRMPFYAPGLSNQHFSKYYASFRAGSVSTKESHQMRTYHKAGHYDNAYNDFHSFGLKNIKKTDVVVQESQTQQGYTGGYVGYTPYFNYEVRLMPNHCSVQGYAGRHTCLVFSGATHPYQKVVRQFVYIKKESYHQQTEQHQQVYQQQGHH